MTFAADVSRFALKADGLQRSKVQYVCMTLLRGVVSGTPVDTGRARGNWQASIGSPSNEVTSNTDRNGNATIAAGTPAAMKAPGTIFYLSNNLPYIYRLEFEGWSKQAPSGWVRYNIERAKQIIARL